MLEHQPLTTSQEAPEVSSASAPRSTLEPTASVLSCFTARPA